MNLRREAPLTDIHVHPSLKAYLFRRNLWRHWGSDGAFNPFASRSDFKALSEGGVARGVAEDDVKKILGGNAQRVLETGWS